MGIISMSGQPIPIDESSRYSMSNYLRDSIKSTKFSIFMEDVDSFLTEEGALYLAAQQLNGRVPEHLADILKIISNATLGWHKLFECLTISEFTDFRAASATFIIPMGVSTVHRTMRVLEREHLIYKFSRGRGYPLYYSLNLVEIFNRLNCIYEIKQVSSKIIHKINMYERLSGSPFLPVFDSITSRFSGRVFKSFEEFKTFVSAHLGEIMPSLEIALKQAKKDAVEVSKAKEQALADQPFFKDDGTPNPRAALAYWYKEIKDSELYPVYIPQNTAKLIGQMKYYLSECRDCAMYEAEIRSNLHEFIIRWNYISDERRIITAMSKNNMLYKVQIPGSPDFSFFYAHRNELTFILMATSVPDKDSDAGIAGTVEEAEKFFLE